MKKTAPLLMRWTAVPVTILVVMAATAVSAGITVPGSSVDEIVARQSAGMESAAFGQPMVGDRYGHSIAIHPVLGLYEDEGVLGGVAGSWHAARLLPWNVGASVGVLDFDLTTWTVALSSGKEVLSDDHAVVVLEGLLGYQFLDKSSDTAVRFQESTAAVEEEVLLDSFDFFHLMLHAICTIDVWFLRPIFDVGWVGTAYRLDGHVWDGRFPVVPGPGRSDDGSTGHATFGLGLALDLEQAVLFGGMKGVRDGVMFQVNVGLAF